MEKISTKVRRPYVHYIQNVPIYQAFFCDSLEKKGNKDFLFLLLQSSLFLLIVIYAAFHVGYKTGFCGTVDSEHCKVLS